MGSPVGEISKVELRKWWQNALLFLAPLGIIYFGSVATSLQGPNHVISLQDFALDSFRLGAILTYLVNVIYDFLRKYATNTNP